MKQILNIGLKLLAILIFLGCLSCEPSDDAIVLSHRIKLQPASFSNNQIELNWNEPYLPGFQRYLIYRSETKPGSIEKRNLCYESGGQIICIDDYYLAGQYAYLSNQSQTTFTDEDVLITDKLYYRVVAMGDTMLISNSIEVEIADVEKLDFIPNDVTYIPDNHSLVFVYYDRNSGETKIAKYNLETSTLSDELTLAGNYSSSYRGLSKGFYNGKTDLYAWNYQTAQYIDPVEFVIKEQIKFNNTVYFMTSDNKGHVFVSLAYDEVLSLNRSGFTEISSLNVNYQGYLFFYQNTLLNVDIGSYPRVTYMSVDENGILSNPNSDYTSIPELTGDFDKELGIVVSYGGTFYDFNLNQIGNITPQFNTYQDRYCFDTDSSQVYATSFSEKEIHVYSLENYSLKRTIPTLGWPLRILLDNNGAKLVISTTSENNPSSILIERF